MKIRDMCRYTKPTNQTKCKTPTSHSQCLHQTQSPRQQKGKKTVSWVLQYDYCWMEQGLLSRRPRPWAGRCLDRARSSSLEGGAPEGTCHTWGRGIKKKKSKNTVQTTTPTNQRYLSLDNQITTTNVTPCVVVDGASQSIPGATGQNADRCFYCLFPVRAFHQPVDNLQKKFTQLKLISHGYTLKHNLSLKIPRQA